jgi:hypothetical protein
MREALTDLGVPALLDTEDSHMAATGKIPPGWQAYPVGTRVRMTSAGEAQIRPRTQQSKTGTLVGFGRDGRTLAVVRDGTVARMGFFYLHWEPVPPAEAAK